jgi:sec-independent protein translocase protein TatA
MGGFSWWHWLILIAVVLVLFGGKGKVSDLMGDVAKGIKSFKKGLSDEDSEQQVAEEAKAIEQAAEPAPKAQAKKAKG